MNWSSHTELYAAFSDIIDGKVVKRSRHDLTWNSEDATPLFLDALGEHGYRATRVADVSVQPGERVPAFTLLERTAYFGWIFWEKFSERKRRKLFGSIVRNRKGDWAIQISSQNSTLVYANLSLASPMDIERPSSV
jgi:hypothetical protein